ncbi:MAG: MFS transporter [Eubacteriales bacterium]
MAINNTPYTKKEVSFTGYSLVIAVLCMLTFAVSFVSRNVWAASIASESTLEALGITATQAGGIASAFYVGYVVSNFFSGFFVDKYGARLILAATAIGTGVATLLIPLASGYWLIIVLRILAGIFAGPIFSGISKMNYGWFSDKVRASAVGFMMSGPAVGMAIASIGFTPLVSSHGYKTAFTIAGIVTVIVGIIVLILLKEKGLAKGGNTRQLTPEDKKKETTEAVKVFVKKDFIINSIMHFLIVGAGQGLQTWILAYLVIDKGLSPAVGGLVFGGAALLGLITGVLSGVISDIFKTRKWLLIVSSVITFMTFYGYTISSSVTVLTMIAVTNQFSRAFMGTPSNTMQTERAKGPYAGKVMGWYNALCQLGSVIFPILTGAILTATGSYTAVMMTLAVSLLLVGILALFIKDTYVRKQEIATETND